MAVRSHKINTSLSTDITVSTPATSMARPLRVMAPVAPGRGIGVQPEHVRGGHASVADGLDRPGHELPPSASP